MTPRGRRVIRGRRDLLYDPKVHGDLLGQFDIVTYPQKVTGSLEVAVTYFMTQKVTVTYFMTPKGNRVIRGRRDLLYYSKGCGYLYGRVDLVYNPKNHRILRGRFGLLYDPKGRLDGLFGRFHLVDDP